MTKKDISILRKITRRARRKHRDALQKEQLAAEKKKEELIREREAKEKAELEKKKVEVLAAGGKLDDQIKKDQAMMKDIKAKLAAKIAAMKKKFGKDWKSKMKDSKFGNYMTNLF